MTKHHRRRRRRPQFRQYAKPGAPPGEFALDPQAAAPKVRAIAYGPDDFEELELDEFSAIGELLQKFAVTWINVEGVGHEDTIRRLGGVFQLHPLAMEDVVQVHQRAKVEQYGQQAFIVVRMPYGVNSHLETEQVSMFVGPKFVLTFLEDPGDVFESVRVNLRGAAGRIRSSGSGYLAYALLDAAVDAYFPLIETFGERMDALEDAVIDFPSKQSISEVHDAKHDLRTLRRAVWPLREALNSLYRDVSPLFDDETRIHLRDCYDHVVQIIDMVETYRELGADLTDLYLSSLSTRMNEVMRVLTIIATLFMPLGFITGLYGMNFDPNVSQFNMPELGWRWGYPFALALMAATTIGMLLFFRRRGWLGGLTPEKRAADAAQTSQESPNGGE
ncbi:MAG TPA: magnesium/cobalt transporter CorA [Pirellulales bacterium]|nr:magnesium/cobalt transporter CorA [Pirellulales bacterium]